MHCDVIARWNWIVQTLRASRNAAEIMAHKHTIRADTVVLLAAGNNVSECNPFCSAETSLRRLRQ